MGKIHTRMDLEERKIMQNLAKSAQSMDKTKQFMDSRFHL